MGIKAQLLGPVLLLIGVAIVFITIAVRPQDAALGLGLILGGSILSMIGAIVTLVRVYGRRDEHSALLTRDGYNLFLVLAMLFNNP